MYRDPAWMLAPFLTGGKQAIYLQRTRNSHGRGVRDRLLASPDKTAPLLHALVAIGLLKSDGDRFLNSPEADQFLVRSSPDYIGMRHYAYRRQWNSVLSVAETIRAGAPQRGMDYASMPADARESFYRGNVYRMSCSGPSARKIARLLELS
jgi:hypothetical protein